MKQGPWDRDDPGNTYNSHIFEDFVLVGKVGKLKSYDMCQMMLTIYYLKVTYIYVKTISDEA